MFRELGEFIGTMLSGDAAPVPPAPPDVAADPLAQNLRRALSISNGALDILWSSPISLAVWVLTALMLTLPLIRIWRRRVLQRRALANV